MKVEIYSLDLDEPRTLGFIDCEPEDFIVTRAPGKYLMRLTKQPRPTFYKKVEEQLDIKWGTRHNWRIVGNLTKMRLILEMKIARLQKHLKQLQ